VLVTATAVVATAVTGTADASAAQAHARHRLAKNYAVGDSVMIDAASSLRRAMRSITVDAVESRQVSTGVAIVAHKKRHHRLNHRIIFGLGTNGTFPKYDLNRLIRLTRGHKLIVLTGHCSYCSWTRSNNRMIGHVCRPSRHCWIAPFAAEARHHPEWFWDGVHMPAGGSGAREYARLVKVAARRAG
jgi:hypothetical protein